MSLSVACNFEIFPKTPVKSDVNLLSITKCRLKMNPPSIGLFYKLTPVHAACKGQTLTTEEEQ